MLWPSPLALIILGALGGLVLADGEKPCVVHDGRKYYDLNPLKSSKDYELRTPQDHLFVFNVCGDVWHETFGLKDQDPAKIGGFLRRDHGDISIGVMNTTVTVQDSRPRLTYTGGSPCKPRAAGNADEPRASTAIEFVCDTSVFGVGKPRLMAVLPPYDDERACGFAIEWRTHLACPTHEGSAMGFFSIVAVILLSVLMLYTLLGTLYNRFVLNLRGFDQIPQFSIESMRYHAYVALEWVKDTYNDYNSRGHLPGDRDPAYFNDYSHNPNQGGQPETNPISHQTQMGGFVRPQQHRSNGSVRNVQTNPVSHQTQVLQTQTPQSPPPPPPPAKQNIPSGGREGTRDEREFMLGEDDDDEGEEMATVTTMAHTPSSATPSPNNSATFSTPATPAGRDTNSGPSVAALRGRDLGTEGVIRL